jgi:hypothetical protein
MDRYGPDIFAGFALHFSVYLDDQHVIQVRD